MSQHIIYRLVLLAVILAVTLSPMGLTAIGWPYTDPAASMIFKVHPATYVVMGVLITLFLTRRGMGVTILADKTGQHHPSWAVQRYIVTLAGIGAAILIIHGGGAAAFMVDTLLLPALIVLLLNMLTPQQRINLCHLVLCLLLINAVIGIFEAATRTHMIPYVIQNRLITGDPRATALFGHPLTNAAIMSVTLFFILTGNRYVRMLAAGSIVYLSLVAFGGRAALIITSIGLLGYSIYIILQQSAARTLDLRLITAIFGIIALLPFAGGYILFATEFGQHLVGRFTWDASAAERLLLFSIFDYMDTQDFLWGMDNIVLENLMSYVGLTWTIENSWIMIMVRFGAILFVVFMISFAGFYRYLMRGLPVIAKLGMLLLLLIVSTNNALAGKTSLLSVVAILALGTKESRRL